MDMAKKFYHPDDLINHFSGWVHSQNDYFTLRHPVVLLRHLCQEKSPCLAPYKSNYKPTHDPSRHEFVKWCLSDRLLRDTELLYVTRWATQYGVLDLVRVLVALGVDSEVGYKDLDANNSRVLWAVTKYTKAGDIACMILRQSPSLIDEDMVKWATRYRRLEVLECVEELIVEDPSQLVSTDAHSILHAAILIACGYGHVEVLEWALGASNSLSDVPKHTTPRPEESALQDEKATDAMDDILTKQLKDPWQHAAQKAEEFGHLHVLKWLGAHDRDAGREVRGYNPFVNGAYRHGHVAVVAWLWEKWMTERPEPVGEEFVRPFKRSLRHAIECGHTDLVAWMLETAGSTPSFTVDAESLAYAEKHLKRKKATEKKKTEIIETFYGEFPEISV